MFHRFSTDVSAFAVLLHGEIRLRFAQVGADETGVFLNRKVAICYCAGECHQFDQCCSAVGVAPGVIRCALDHLRVRLNGAGPICLFKLLATELARFFGFFGVDVGFFFSFDLGFFCGAELVENVWGAMFGEGFLVVFDGMGQVVEFLVSAAYSAEGSVQS